MQDQRLAFRIAATIASFVILPQGLHAQDCEAFAKYGIYDTRHETSDIDKTESFRSWFCQSKFESKEAADTTGLRLGYGAFYVGFDSNKESWSAFSEDYCRDDSYRIKYREATNSFVQTINANASNNMLACFLRDGLHVRIIPGGRRDTFFVDTRYTSTGKVKSARVTFFDYPKGVTCSGTLKKGAPIDGAGAIAKCTRPDNEAVDITFKATEKEHWDSPMNLKEMLPPEIPWPERLKKPITANLLPGIYDIRLGPVGGCRPQTGKPVVVLDAKNLFGINECGLRSRIVMSGTTITFLDHNNLNADVRRNEVNGAIEIHGADGNSWVNGPDKLR